MPVYEYDCARCGSFVASRKIAARNDPSPCPECGTCASRVILTAPAFSGMPATSRVAHATNERAAHDPKFSSAHRAGCSCCAGAGKTTSAKSAGAPKAFADKRPWMISH